MSADGRFVAALSTTPEATAGDLPRFYGFLQGQELTRIAGQFSFQDFHPAGFLFHYGDHSNHLPHVCAGPATAGWWPETTWCTGLRATEAVPNQFAHLGQGLTTAFAASASGPAVVGRFQIPDASSRNLPNLLVVKPDGQKPIVWARSVPTDVAPSPPPEKGIYGPPTPPYRDVKFQAALAVAITAKADRIAVADYQGWQRIFHPRDGSAPVPFGTRFMPSRPTIQVYDGQGHTIRRLDPKAFPEPFWCDLAFSTDGQKLLITPHNWTSRGLAGQSFLPADETARTIYLLDLANGALQAVRFPGAIASADIGGNDRVAVGCWDHRVYLLDRNGRLLPSLPRGLEVGAASLVRIARDGQRIAVATTAGTVRLLDPVGKELWQVDLNQAAQPWVKPGPRNLTPGRFGPGIWRTGIGRYHSDLGSQILVEAPRGLILIDPNAGASLAENWALIEAAGLDPRQLKYILLTHEHGDHAPGASLWRVLTGAQVIASAEMAYILQHHIPGGTGYGFHPPVPADVVLTGDQELDLAGLKVKAIRLPGHTSGSMGYVFQKAGRTYVATGDLIMNGGVLGYSGSLDFSAQDVLSSLKKLAALRPDMVLGGHGSGDPDEFIAKGIEAGEATGWSKMIPVKPNPLYRFTQTNYLVAAWLEPILSAAYGDVDGDGRPDVAVLVSRGQGSAVKIYLNKGGKFARTPDAEVDLPDLNGGWKLRLVRLGKNKMADFFVSSENQAVLLLSQPERFRFKTVPLPVIRGSQVATGSFHDQVTTDLLIGSRFLNGYAIAEQGKEGAFRVRPSRKPTPTYLDLALADVNGDQREDLILSNGDIYLRQRDGSLPETPSFHLNPPSGEMNGWTFLAAADFDHDGWTDVALLSNSKEGTTVWLYRNTRNPQQPFTKEPTAKFVVPDVDVNRDGPTIADWNGDGIPDLFLCQRGQQAGVCILTGAPVDGLSPQRKISVKLDYVPHFDTRFGVADFNADGRVDLAGFGRSPTGAEGVYIWLQPRGEAK